MTSMTTPTETTGACPAWCREHQDDRPAATITHPVWCTNYPEPNGRLRGECDGEHLGVDYHLDAGVTASYQVTATAVEGFEVIDGNEHSHGLQVQVTVYDREGVGVPESAYLDPAEVERLRRLLDLAARDLTLQGRA